MHMMERYALQAYQQIQLLRSKKDRNPVEDQNLNVLIEKFNYIFTTSTFNLLSCFNESNVDNIEIIEKIFSHNYSNIGEIVFSNISNASPESLGNLVYNSIQQDLEDNYFLIEALIETLEAKFHINNENINEVLDDLKADLKYSTRHGDQNKIIQFTKSISEVESLIGWKKKLTTPKFKYLTTQTKLSFLLSQHKISLEEVDKKIEELEEDIAYLKKRNMKDKILQTENDLANMQKISELKNQLNSSEFYELKLQSEIEQTSNALNITNFESLQRKISDLNEDLDYLRRRSGFENEIIIANNTLNLCHNLQNLYAQLEKYKSKTHNNANNNNNFTSINNDNTPPPSLEIQQQNEVPVIKEGLTKGINLNDEELETKIKQYEEDIIIFEKRNKKEKVEKVKNKLHLLQEEKNRRYNKSTSDYETSISEINSQIELLEEDYDRYKRRSNQVKAEKIKTKLEELYTISKKINSSKAEYINDTRTSNYIDRPLQEHENNNENEPNLEKSLFTDFKFNELPECAEKTIYELCSNIPLGLVSQSEIEKYLQKLKYQLENQNLNNSEVNDLLHKFSFDYNKVTLLKSILKIIHPVNIHEIEYLVDKTIESGKLIKDKDITLFIGETGVGKSTTILYLSGIRMKKDEVDGLPHISPVTALKGALQQVKTNPHSKSETRYIYPVEVINNTICDGLPGTTTLCDAAGYGDTCGIEVDVANGIGLVRALGNCKSVKIVAVSSYKSLGDRGEGIRKLAHLLVDLVGDVTNRLNSIIYIFTKYPANFNINAVLNDIYNQSSASDDSVFESVLLDMVSKTKKANFLHINPIDGKPGDLLRNITKIEGILYPNEVFRSCMSEESRNKLQSQSLKFKNFIDSSFRKGNYELTEYYLTCLKTMYSLINLQFIEEDYNDAKNTINEFIKMIYTKKTREIEKLLRSLDGIQLEDVNYFKRTLDELDNFKIFARHEDLIVYNRHDILNYLLEEISKRDLEVSQMETVNIHHKLLIDNFHILSQHFKEFQLPYVTKVQKIEDHYKELCQSIMEMTKNYDFTVTKIPLKEMELGCSFYSAKVPSILTLMKKIMASIEKILTALVKNTQSNLENLKNRDIEEVIIGIQENIQNLYKFQADEDLCDLFSKYSNIDTSLYYSENLLIIKKEFNLYKKKIKATLEKPQLRSSEITSILTPLKRINSSIPEIKDETDHIMESIEDDIKSYQEQLIKESQELLIFEKNTSKNYRILANSFTRIRNASEWLSEVDLEGKAGNALQHFEEEIKLASESLVYRAKSIDISVLKNYNKIFDVTKILITMVEKKPLEPHFSFLRDDREETFKYVYFGIVKALDTINNSFNYESREIKNFENELNNLKKIRDDYRDKNYYQIELKKLMLSCSLPEYIKQKKMECTEKVNRKRKRIQTKEIEYHMMIEEQQQQQQSDSIYGKLKEWSGAQNKFNETLQLIKEKLDLKKSNLVTFIKKESEIIDNLEELQKNLETNHSPNEEQIKLLEENNIQSISDLNSVIQNLENTVISSRDRKLPYCFDKLDIHLAQNTRKYIQICENEDLNLLQIYSNEHHGDSYQDRLKRTNDRFVTYIREYINYLVSEITDSANKIWSEDDFDEKLSSKLHSNIREIMGFRQREDLFTDLDIQLSEKIDDLRNVFLNYLSKISSMNSFDNYIGKKLGAFQILDSELNLKYNEISFGSFLIQYQQNIRTEFSQNQKELMEKIAKRDFKGIPSLLESVISLNPSQKILEQIKIDLNYAVTREITQIKNNLYNYKNMIDRIRASENDVSNLQTQISIMINCATKKVILEYTTEQTRKKLIKFEEEIIAMISEFVKESLASLQANIEDKDFVEAEFTVQNVRSIYDKLSLELNMNDDAGLRKDIETKEQELEKIAETLKKDIEKLSISNFFGDSPKNLIIKLEKAEKDTQKRKYANMKQSLLEHLKKLISQEIDNIRISSLDGRESKIETLKYNINYLPQELRSEFSNRISDLHELTNVASSSLTNYLNQVSSITVNNTDTVFSLYTIYMKIKNEGGENTKYFTQAYEEVLKQVNECANLFDQYIVAGQTSECLIFVKILFSFSILFQNEKIDKIAQKFQDSVIRCEKEYQSSCKMTENINSVKNVIRGLENVALFQTLSQFKCKSKCLKILNSKIVMNTSRAVCNRIKNYFSNLTTKLGTACKLLNADGISNIVSNYEEEGSQIFETITKLSSNRSTENTELIKALNNQGKFPSLKCIKNEISKTANSIASNLLSIELYTQQTSNYVEVREQYFLEMENNMKFLVDLQSKIRHELGLPELIREINEVLCSKISKMNDELLKCSKKNNKKPEDCDFIRIRYEHLDCIKNTFRNIKYQTNIVNSLVDCEAAILDEVQILHTNFIASKEIEVASENLIRMKLLEENLPILKNRITTEIDKSLQNFLKTNKIRDSKINLTSLSVNLERSEYGQKLLSDHSVLKHENIHQRRAKFIYDKISDCAERLIGNYLDKQKITTRYNTVMTDYYRLIKEYYTSSDFSVLISNIKNMAALIRNSKSPLTWDSNLRDKLPPLVAAICALWTLKNTDSYYAERGINDHSYLLSPHVGQIIAIFRILGIGYKKTDDGIIGAIGSFFGHPRKQKLSMSKLDNNLVEVLTGEGKSVILGISACVFSLLGFEVNCSCYSEILSYRDKNNFSNIFSALGVESMIEYGTFYKLCEELLNQQINLRDHLKQCINENIIETDSTLVKLKESQKILMIDEVDVFLSSEYYGGMYCPSFIWQNEFIWRLLIDIWNYSKEGHVKLQTILNLQSYKECAKQFHNYVELLYEAVKDLISTVRDFNAKSIIYRLTNNTIEYLVGEIYSSKVVHGYHTIWTYFYECDNNQIPENILKERVGIIVTCGTFSYAEMPHDFSYITGVTGTLKTLADEEVNILSNTYGINIFTYIPSVYRDCQRLDLGLELCNSSDEYYKVITTSIQSCIDLKLAVLVFFEDQNLLDQYYDNDNFKHLRDKTQIITEKVSKENREMYIKRAPTVGKITLITKSYGRGTDFVISNPELELNGGIFVIQTFFSKEISEEFQIKGRCARQGDKGKFQLIILDNTLEWLLGANWKEEIASVPRKDIYNYLNEKRMKQYNLLCSSKSMGIEDLRKNHQMSIEFMNQVLKGKINTSFLKYQNLGAELAEEKAKISRTVLLMDGTGSMSSTIEATKETICSMFQRAAEILKERGLPDDIIQMQIAIYRDYDCKNDILQHSQWESRPINLRNFLASVVAKGGGDYEEAIEIGLNHAYLQAETDIGIDQVILIGDAPAKELPAIERDRGVYGGEAFWKTTRYQKITNWRDEIKNLQNCLRGPVPVNCFYLHSCGALKENFAAIANETHGKCEYLNTSGKSGAETLTNLVTESVLFYSAGQEAVDAYRRKYCKSFLS